MTRRRLLFAGLAAAMAMTVLLRAAAPQAEAVDVHATDANPAPEAGLVSFWEASDCAITTDRDARPVFADAAQPAQKAPGDVAEISVASHANGQRAALTAERRCAAPLPARRAFRPTIRPPPPDA